MARVSFLVSTLGRNPSHLLELLQNIEKQSHSDVDAVVVLQSPDKTTIQAVEEAVSGIQAPVKLVVSDTIGLSKSRNIALANAQGDILLLCDDDCSYPPDAAAHIVEAMAEHPNWDVIEFQMAEVGTGKLLKRYCSHSYKHNLRSLMHVSSVEISMRKCITPGVRLFDERIGLGTPYITGEEIVMLIELYNKGINIGYSPNVIVSHPKERSGCGASHLPQLVLSKGVAFRRMFGWLGLFPAVAFS